MWPLFSSFFFHDCNVFLYVCPSGSRFMVKLCSVCKESQAEEAFSKKQWAAKAHTRKCLACSTQDLTSREKATAAGAAGGGTNGDHCHVGEGGRDAPGNQMGLPQLLGEARSQTHVPGRLVRIKGLVKAHVHNGKLAKTLKVDSAADGRTAIVTKNGKELRVEHKNIEAVCLACSSVGTLVCGKCKTATFCSITCQKAAWPMHINECADGKLVVADCQETLKRSETVFFLSRCDGFGAFYLNALHRKATGGTVSAMLVIGICRGIVHAKYTTAPHLNTWTSAASFKAHIESVQVVGDDNKDAGGATDGRVRETHRRVCSDLAAAIARHAEHETR